MHHFCLTRFQIEGWLHCAIDNTFCILSDDTILLSGSRQAKIRLSPGICHNLVDCEAFQSFSMNTVVGKTTIFVLGANNLSSNNTLYSLGSL